MEKGDLKTILIITGVIIIVLVVLIKLKNNVTGASITDSESNIKQAAPTPTSCTSTQNCGRSTCDAASGRGSCGCGG